MSLNQTEALLQSHNRQTQQQQPSACKAVLTSTCLSPLSYDDANSHRSSSRVLQISPCVCVCVRAKLSFSRLIPLFFPPHRSTISCHCIFIPADVLNGQARAFLCTFDKMQSHQLARLSVCDIKFTHVNLR